MRCSMETVKCALCHSEDYRVVLTAEDYRLHTIDEKINLVQCRHCGLVYVNPRPTKEEMGKFYPKNYYGKQGQMAEVVIELIHNMKIKKIMSFKKKGRILDVGCGDGGFLLHFKERGWEAYGVDVSEVSYKLAMEKLGRYVFNCELKDCHFPDSYFEVVTFNHVLEHMPDPNEELREAYRILKDDGVLLLSTPNVDSFQFNASRERWFGLDLPRHLYHYSPKTINAMLKKNGFKVVKITRPLLDFPLDLFQSLKGKWLDNRSRCARVIFYLPLLITSTLIKLLPAWRATLEVVAQKLQ